MATVPTANYGGISPSMAWKTDDNDPFNRTDVANTSIAVENHDHTTGKGLPAGRLNFTNALTNQGDVYINTETFTFKGQASTHTIATLDANNTWTGTNDFSGITTANNFKMPVIANAAPTENGAMSYDSTANEVKVGVDGSTVSLLTTSGGPIPTDQGGTGADFSSSNNQLVVTAGSSAMEGVGPGTSGYPLISGGSGVNPSYTQLTGGGIASGTITGGNIASGTIGGGNIASGTITGSNIAAGTISNSNLASSAIPVVHSANGSIAQISTTSSSFVDADGTNLSVSFTPSGTAPCMAFVNLLMTDSGGTNCIATLNIDGTDQNDLSAGGAFMYNLGTLSNASHTVKLRFKSSGGGQATIRGDLQMTNLYVVEYN